MPELSPSQVRQLSLAGTISCPPQFPDLFEICRDKWGVATDLGMPKVNDSFR